MSDLTLLTRVGCRNTPALQRSLDVALRDLQSSITYIVVDAGELSHDDVRRGYPTPTVLWRGADLFGLPAPTPPWPSPT